MARDTTPPVLSEKYLPHAIAEDLVAYCDPHDLVAIATDAHDIVVYRINGQTAFTVRRKEDLNVTAVAWKQDGSQLAVGWSDGTYGLYSGENGRLLNQGSVRTDDREKAWKLDLTPDYGDDDEEQEGCVVARFGWMVHQPHTRGSHLSAADALESDSDLWMDDAADELNDLFITDVNEKGNGAAAISKLTRTIATLDVTTVLPRLSSIPSHGPRIGPEGSKFASQSATDGVFGPDKDPTSDEVDSLLVCTSDGRVLVLQDDTVPIGSCVLTSPSLMHASHHASASHAVLCRIAEDTFVPNLLELPLETLGGQLLHVIATSTKRIQNLLAYITQTIRCIQHDFMTGLQFPTRLLSNLETDLTEKEEGDAVTNLYHLAMTGIFSPIVKEWLVDIVKETNHKRWDQAANSMYTNIQNHIFINLLPALDRLYIATTTLRGHATFHQGSSRFEVSPDLLTKILDGIDSLRVVAHKAQLIVMSEHRQFRAFSKWLKVMIEVGVAGPGSKSAIEAEEREVPNLDYPLLLAYIKDTMTKSQLARYFVQRPSMNGNCTRQEFLQHSLMKQMSYDRTMEASRRLDELVGGQIFEMKEVEDAEALLNMPAIVVYLAGNVRTTMESIAQWQSKMLPKPTSLELDDQLGFQVLDMQMTSVKGVSNLHLLLCSKAEPNEYRIHSHPLVSNSAPAASPDIWTVPVDKQHIVDGKLWMQTKILLLVSDEQGFHVLLDSERPTPAAILYSVPADSGFKPEKLIVGGRTGRKVCLLLGNGGRQWRALDLDSIVARVDTASTDEMRGHEA